MKPILTESYHEKSDRNVAFERVHKIIILHFFYKRITELLSEPEICEYTDEIARKGGRVAKAVPDAI